MMKRVDMNKSVDITKGIFLALFLLPVLLLAQQEETGNWMMYSGTNKINDKFSIHTEVQYRNHTIVPNTVEQLLLRTGVNYFFSNKALAAAGYGYIPSYVFGPEQKIAQNRGISYLATIHFDE